MKKTGHRVQPQAISGNVEQVQAPSRITHLHVQDRETSKVAGSPRAWRAMTEVENAYQLDRLGPKDSHLAHDRLSAALTYTRLWDTAQGRSRDSTEAFHFVDGGGQTDLGDAQRAALARLAAIEAHLGVRDKLIVRCVCGLGHTPKQAMVAAKLSADTRVTPRLCEALDALADAVDRTARSRRR